MPTATIVSVSEYLATSYRPDCDYLDGKILERNVGEWEHSRLQGAVSCYLYDRERQWRIIPVIAQRVQVTATRFRVPDILAVARPPSGPIVEQPPILCVEILSRSDRMAEMQERIDDYLGFGVRSVWLIHAHTRRAFVYTAERVQEVKDGILSVEGTDICVPLHDLE
jgi:Uma2 family endonuclease